MNIEQKDALIDRVFWTLGLLLGGASVCYLHWSSFAEFTVSTIVIGAAFAWFEFRKLRG